jgi:glycosidase
MPHPLYPSLYQVHTRLWLSELGDRLGRAATLDDIPDADLDRIASLGFDWVWPLGVWQTGPASRQVALTDPGCLRGYREVLPDFTDADVYGSPFAVQSYSVHADFGGDSSLARLRQRLRDRGIRLLLDFVPNHTGLDHAWVREHPEFYIQGTEADLSREPQYYRRMETRAGSVILAHGRDPYFPGWTDTLQLNYRHPGLRAAMIAELARVADRCDGVRCDMAMLLLPDVILRTWGDRSVPGDGQPPVDTPFWPEAIAQVRRRHPDFLFMAEVYWDLEWTLQQQGFDYTYDKRLYDRLRSKDAEEVRGHLRADLDFQRKCVRFLENHDEPRAASVFPVDVHRAAAVLAFFTPGMRFFHEGQLEGRRIMAAMQLRRRQVESADPAIRDFYSHLLEGLKRPEVRGGAWQLLECRAAWDGNATWNRLIAFAWAFHAGIKLVGAVNYGRTQGQCYVQLPFPELTGRPVVLRDLLSPARYEREGNELISRGLYLDLPAWGHHLFEVI